MVNTDIQGALTYFNEIFENLGLTEFYARIVVSIIAFIIFLIIGWIVDHVFERIFKRWAKKTKTKLDDEIIKNVKKPIYVLVIFFGLNFTLWNLGILAQYEIVEDLLVLFEILLIAYIFTRITNVLFVWYAERQERKKKASKHILYVFRGIFNGIVYLIAFFIFLAIQKVDLTGLAIGGAATAIVIGFALQHMLSDFFSGVQVLVFLHLAP